MNRRSAGFSLIELMAAVAIVSIISAVAIPAYTDHVTRGRLTEAFSGLGGAQSAAEQYWANNRTYVGFGSANSFPKAGSGFSYALSDATASAYTLTATGKGNMSGWTFTIDQSGNRQTKASPTGWGTSTSCWVDKKGGKCSS